MLVFPSIFFKLTNDILIFCVFDSRVVFNSPENGVEQ